MADNSTADDRRILITGAAGGMGRVCADLAASEGYELILADLAGTGVSELAQDFSGQGTPASSHHLDVTDTAAITWLVQAMESGPGLDAVIHTVGVSPQMADWERIFDIDLVGTAVFLDAVRPVIKPAGAAVCFSSMSAYLCPSDEVFDTAVALDPLSPDFLHRVRALPGHPLQDSGLAYSVAKKSLQRFVEYRARDWGAEGKRLVSLSPGLIATEMGQLEFAATKNFDAMLQGVALGRLGNPQEIARTALFLVSSNAAYITGCDVLVDGGFIATYRQQRHSVSVDR